MSPHAPDPDPDPPLPEVAALRAVFAGPDGPGRIEAAARAGLVEAQVLHGQILLDGGQHQAALNWFRIAADAGHAPAINMLGRCCDQGWGMAPDPARAVGHYRRAAALGLDWGQYNLATALLHGLGVGRDRVAAYALFRQAAAQGHAKAMNLIGRFHEEGWDRPPDPARAARWYRRGAEAGDCRAQFNWATILAAQGRETEALVWLRRALAAGSADFVASALAALRVHPAPALRALARESPARGAPARETPARGAPTRKTPARPKPSPPPPIPSPRG